MGQLHCRRQHSPGPHMVSATVQKAAVAAKAFRTGLAGLAAGFLLGEAFLPVALGGGQARSGGGGGSGLSGVVPSSVGSSSGVGGSSAPTAGAGGGSSAASARVANSQPCGRLDVNRRLPALRSCSCCYQYLTCSACPFPCSAASWNTAHLTR